ncbi:MAG TPA: hypothetical protein VMY99_01955 [Nevskiaceae bacterium]|nr:hypothetical protein [Nevskiaceae bacterium]
MTYLPPLNGGRINATISGNTAGAGALVSSGTMTLAGGNNITLSQAGNAITISGGAGGGAGSNTLGMSNLGNSIGTSGVISGSALQFGFAGGNNVTLSQSINASSATITISAANQTNQTVGLYGLGNTTQNSSTTLDARSLSFNGLGGATVGYSNGSIQISAPQTAAQTNQTVGLYALGNTTQNSSTTLDARSLSFNGLGAATMGYSNGSIQVSVAAQTVQTQNLHNVTLSGNTAGAMAHISSGTLTLAGGNNITLSQNGNAVTISAGAGGGGGVALANSQATYSSGTVNLLEGGGAITIASSAGGQSFKVSVPQTSSLSATGAVSLSTNGSTISIGAPVYSPMSQWIHNSAAMYSSSTSAMVNTSVSLVRMLIPEQLSFSRVDVPVSVSGATQSSANTAAMALSAVGVLYSRNASTLNPIVGQSSTTTYSYASNTGVYSSITGPRMLSFNLATSLTAGEYYFGFQLSSATSSVGTATTNLGWTVAPVFGTSYTVLPWQDISAATNQTINLYQPLQGMKSIAITNTTMTHQQSQITQSGATAIRANLVVILRNG